MSLKNLYMLVLDIISYHLCQYQQNIIVLKRQKSLVNFSPFLCCVKLVIGPINTLK